MIETNFKPDWSFSFVENNAAAEPNTARANFKTIKHSLITLTFTPPATVHGVVGTNARAKWLYWLPGFITEVPTLGYDVFSGPFSGCWMMAYADNDNRPFVGHIGTDVGDNNLTVKQAWQNFAGANTGRLGNGFNPLREYSGPITAPHGNEKALVFGLITSVNKCFSIFTHAPPNVNPPVYRIIGIQEQGQKSPVELRDIFRFDADVAGNFPFTLNEWKTGTSGGVFRSAELKQLDTAVSAFIQQKNAGTLLALRTSFNTWKNKNPKEYNNPNRHRGLKDCIQLLEAYLLSHP